MSAEARPSVTGAATGPDRAAVRRTRALTVLAAVVGGLLGWALLRLLGTDLVVRTGAGADAPTQEINLAAVGTAGLVAGLAAWLLLALLEKLTAGRARTIFTVVTVIVLVVSLLGPLSATTGGGRAGLAFLHVVVGGILIAGLRRTARTS